MKFDKGIKLCSMASLGATLWMTGTTLASDPTTRHAGARVHKAVSGTHAIYGRSMAVGQTPSQAAERWIQENGAVLGVRGGELRLLRTGRVGSGDLQVFTYQQFMDGLPVEGGLAKVLVRAGNSNPVVYVGARLAPRGKSRLQVDRLTGAQALTTVQAMPGYAGLAVWSAPEKVIFYRDGKLDRLEPVRAWKFQGTLDTPDTYESYTFFVNAANGRLVHVQNEVWETGEITGTVTGWASPGTLPDTKRNPPAEVFLEGAGVRVQGGNSTFSDPNGDYSLDHSTPYPATVEADLVGQWVNVRVCAGESLVLEQVLSAPGTADFEFNPPPNTVPGGEWSTSQVNCMVHATGTHDFYKDRQPDYTPIDISLRCIANVPFLGCNALFAGSGMFFGLAAGNCVNMAYTSVIAHEYGHFIFLGQVPAIPNGAFHEGAADTTSILQFDDPVLGRDIEGRRTYKRDARQLVEYPCPSNKIHFCGQVLSGTWWDIKLNLEEHYEGIVGYVEDDCPVSGFPVETGTKCGLEVARQLFTDWSRFTMGTSEHLESADPQTAIEVMTADDTALYGGDGDLSNGTPHFVEICEAFLTHNIPSPFDCNRNCTLDSVDIATGFSQDENLNGIPDECDLPTPPLGAAPPHDARKNRYLSFQPNNAGLSVAFQIEMTAGPGTTGVLGWLTDPVPGPGGAYIAQVVKDVCDAGAPVPGAPCLADADCLPGVCVMNPLRSFRAWPEPLVHIGDCEIVPVATYELRAETAYQGLSDPLELGTIELPASPQTWGDIVGDKVDGVWMPPNGVTNFVDVQAALECVEVNPEAPHWTWCDVDPEIPNAVTNINDVFWIIKAFQGDPYPFSDPAACPQNP